VPQEVNYTTRYSTPDWIQRGVAQVIELPIYRDGSLVAPTSGTVSLIDHNGEAVVDEQAVTITANIVTYNIAAITIPDTMTVSDRWQEIWTLLVNGISYTFQREAALVIRRLYPVVTDLDLTRLHSEMRQWLSDDQTSLQGYIDAAWDDILLRLQEDGRWPYLVMSPSSLRGAHLALSLSNCFLDYSSSAAGPDGKYAKLAEHYAEKFEKAWDRLKFSYDFSNNGGIDPSEKSVSGSPVLMTTVPGRWGRWP